MKAENSIPWYLKKKIVFMQKKTNEARICEKKLAVKLKSKSTKDYLYIDTKFLKMFGPCIEIKISKEKHTLAFIKKNNEPYGIILPMHICGEN